MSAMIDVKSQKIFTISNWLKVWAHFLLLVIY